jgi:hypothetical protein
MANGPRFSCAAKPFEEIAENAAEIIEDVADF